MDNKEFNMAERAQKFDKVYENVRTADVELTDFILSQYGLNGADRRVKELQDLLGRARTLAHELNEHFSWD